MPGFTTEYSPFQDINTLVSHNIFLLWSPTGIIVFADARAFECYLIPRFLKLHKHAGAWDTPTGDFKMALSARALRHLKGHSRKLRSVSVVL